MINRRTRGKCYFEDIANFQSFFLIFFILLISCDLNKRHYNEQGSNQDIFKSENIDSIQVYCYEYNYPKLLEFKTFPLSYPVSYVVNKKPLFKIENRDTINLVCDLLNDIDTVYSNEKNNIKGKQTNFIIRINDNIYLLNSDDFRFFYDKMGVIEYNQPIVYNILKLKDIYSIRCEKDEVSINYKGLKEGDYKPKKHECMSPKPQLRNLNEL